MGRLHFSQKRSWQMCTSVKLSHQHKMPGTNSLLPSHRNTGMIFHYCVVFNLYYLAGFRKSFSSHIGSNIFAPCVLLEVIYKVQEKIKSTVSYKRLSRQLVASTFHLEAPTKLTLSTKTVNTKTEILSVSFPFLSNLTLEMIKESRKLKPEQNWFSWKRKNNRFVCFSSYLMVPTQQKEEKASVLAYAYPLARFLLALVPWSG